MGRTFVGERQWQIASAIEIAGAKDSRYNWRLIRALGEHGLCAAAKLDMPSWRWLPPPHSDGWQYPEGLAVYGASHHASAEAYNWMWHALNAWPTKTGWYLVGHAGHQDRVHFFANDRDWLPGTKLGWQDGAFANGPTHWKPCEPAPDSEDRYWEGSDEPNVRRPKREFPGNTPKLAKRPWWRFW